MLTRTRVGWIVDNILNYEIVLASGEITSANQTHNSDLFKALKGGGPNFGIVTQVDIAAFDFKQYWGGQLVLPLTDTTADQTLRAITNLTAAVDPDASAQVVFAHLADGTSIVDIVLASLDDIERPALLEPFFAMQPQLTNTASHRKLGDLVHEVSTVQPDGYR